MFLNLIKLELPVIIKAEDIGLPGIPYWRNSGSAAILYLNRDGVAYAMCGPDFFCSEELNAKRYLFYAN